MQYNFPKQSKPKLRLTHSEDLFTKIIHFFNNSLINLSQIAPTQKLNNLDLGWGRLSLCTS